MRLQMGRRRGRDEPLPTWGGAARVARPLVGTHVVAVVAFVTNNLGDTTRGPSSARRPRAGFRAPGWRWRVGPR